jgi:hypothetical protein
MIGKSRATCAAMPCLRIFHSRAGSTPTRLIAPTTSCTGRRLLTNTGSSSTTAAGATSWWNTAPGAARDCRRQNAIDGSRNWRPLASTVRLSTTFPVAMNRTPGIANPLRRAMLIDFPEKKVGLAGKRSRVPHRLAAPLDGRLPPLRQVGPEPTRVRTPL